MPKSDYNADGTKKGGARKGKPKGSRLAFDDTKQEADKIAAPAQAKRGRGRPKKAAVEASGGSTAKSGGGNAWRTHLTKTFNAGKKKNANYKYSQAMKDAAKTYKKPK